MAARALIDLVVVAGWEDVEHPLRGPLNRSDRGANAAPQIDHGQSLVGRTQG
jgi:hypothetical protein